MDCPMQLQIHLPRSQQMHAICGLKLLHSCAAPWHWLIVAQLPFASHNKWSICQDCGKGQYLPPEDVWHFSADPVPVSCPHPNLDRPMSQQIHWPRVQQMQIWSPVSFQHLSVDLTHQSSYHQKRMAYFVPWTRPTPFNRSCTRPACRLFRGARTRPSVRSFEKTCPNEVLVKIFKSSTLEDFGKARTLSAW